MKPEQIKIEIEGLELSEKLTLVEDIWDSIAESNAVLPLPKWQQQELDKRYEAFTKGELGLHSLEGITENISKKVNET